MSKTIIRVVKNKSNPYVIMNKTPLHDTRLSGKAKGIMAYLLSLPDDWQIYEQEISKHSKDGIKGLKTGMKELMDNGYIERTKVRGESGRFKGWEYRVYEISPTIPFTDVGKTDVRKRHTTNNNLTNNDSTEYNNDNGVSPNGEHTHYTNQDVVKAISVYINDLYKQKTRKRHPFLKPEQYQNVYNRIAAHCDEWGTDYDGLVAMMCQFLNSKIESDWNINHFATEGIMMNRMYEVAY